MTNTTAERLSSARDRSKHGRQQEEGVLVIRTIAMPAGTNPAGDIFGGWSRSRFEKESQKVTDADFVFVALDEFGQPRELPEK